MEAVPNSLVLSSGVAGQPSDVSCPSRARPGVSAEPCRPDVDRPISRIAVCPGTDTEVLQPPEPCVGVPVDKGIARPHTRRACGPGADPS